MAFPGLVQISVRKRKEISMYRPLVRSQSLGCIPNLLSLRLPFRCEKGCASLLKVTDNRLFYVHFRTKDTGRGGRTHEQVPSSPGTFQSPHWVSVDSLQLPHHRNMRGEKGNVKDFYMKSGRVGFGMDFNHRKPTVAQFLLFVSLTHERDIGLFPGKTV